MVEQKFRVGQVVVATSNYGGLLTEGKQYVVIKYEDKFYDTNFTWPAYVTVIGDLGKPVTGHTYRFRAVEVAGPDQHTQIAKEQQ
jgi:hypothetical protein